MQSLLKHTTGLNRDIPAAFDVTKPSHDLQSKIALQRMAVVANTSALKLMQEYCSLAFGPGQISFKDYIRLRLFDNEFYSDKRAVIGQRKNSDIDLTINFRHDWIGLFANKIASASYLAAHGFPTIPVLGIYNGNIASASSVVVRDRDELRAFLVREDSYPIFGKPIEGIQSIGSFGIKRYVAASECLETIGGQTISLEGYISDIVKHYSHGYMFQKFLSPHGMIRAACGDRLATIRVVTLALDGEPEVFRACWKIPAGSNVADNYWRAGNLLARVDVSNGRVQRVMTGTGLDLTDRSDHPDTQQRLIGMDIPYWTELRRTAIEAARLMQQMPLIGFDMAVLDTGPVIVEMNHNPDFFLNQLADGRGVLDPALIKFISDQKKRAAERSKTILLEARKL